MDFRKGWWSFDLGEGRPCFATYCLFPYEELPPIDNSQFRGDFGWLAALDESLDVQMSIYRPNDEEQTQTSNRLKNLQAQASEQGVALPDEFVRFMGDTILQHRIPSCTACYFHLSETPLIPSPAEANAALIPFLRDQQDCVVWYLYVGAGDPYVVAGAPDYNLQSTEDLFYCSPGFEPFLYRFWLENTIWFALHDQQDGVLNAEQQAYLRHYQPE